MGVKIITDSASDITQAFAGKLGIKVIPMTTTFGSTEYLDGVTLTNREFFEKLVETDEFPHTSQINPFQYEEVFRQAVSDGSEAVYIALSSKLSGSCGGAFAAAAEFEGKVFVVDSENVSIGQQILTLYAVRLREQGLSAAEITRELETRRGDIRVLALLDTLEYRHGGFCGRTAVHQARGRRGERRGRSCRPGARIKKRQQPADALCGEKRRYPF